MTQPDTATGGSARVQHTDGPELPEVVQHLAMPATPVTGRVASTARCTVARGGKAASFVRHVTIDVSGTALAGKMLPGQSFGVIPPGTDARGLSHKVRLYSLASPTGGEDGTGDFISTTVKRTIDEHHETGKLFLGVASNFLCDCQPGDAVTLTGPSGKRFLLPRRPHEHDYLFVATGTGIAPFRGMVNDLLRAGVSSRIVLVMGSAYATDLLYDEDFRDLAARHANFHYMSAISRERQADGHGPMYVQDRFDSDAGELMPMFESGRTLLYMCGIAGMELAIFQRVARTVPASAIGQYLGIDAEAGDPASWTRRMIHRQVRPTRRVFIEVY